MLLCRVDLLATDEREDVVLGMCWGLGFDISHAVVVMSCVVGK